VRSGYRKPEIRRSADVVPPKNVTDTP
jgi:hypothetical protein